MQVLFYSEFSLFFFELFSALLCSLQMLNRINRVKEVHKKIDQLQLRFTQIRQRLVFFTV